VGASWVSEHILERKPNAQLSVYVVWVPQFGAHRGDIDTSLFHDPRARVYWDSTGAVANAVVGTSDTYDVYALYDGDAQLRWNTSVSSGGTVIANSDRIEHDLEQLLS
jgi:hypothetical protein